MPAEGGGETKKRGRLWKRIENGVKMQGQVKSGLAGSLEKIQTGGAKRLRYLLLTIILYPLPRS